MLSSSVLREAAVLQALHAINFNGLALEQGSRDYAVDKQHKTIRNPLQGFYTIRKFSDTEPCNEEGERNGWFVPCVNWYMRN